MSETKPFIISKTLVMEAYKLVKANAGAAGIDQQTLEDFDRNLKSNLYKIWNRMSLRKLFSTACKSGFNTKEKWWRKNLGNTYSK